MHRGEIASIRAVYIDAPRARVARILSDPRQLPSCERKLPFVEPRPCSAERSFSIRRVGRGVVVTHVERYRLKLKALAPLWRWYVGRGMERELEILKRLSETGELEPQGRSSPQRPAPAHIWDPQAVAQRAFASN